MIRSDTAQNLLLSPSLGQFCLARTARAPLSASWWRGWYKLSEHHQYVLAVHFHYFSTTTPALEKYLVTYGKGRAEQAGEPGMAREATTRRLGSRVDQPATCRCDAVLTQQEDRRPRMKQLLEGVSNTWCCV